MSYHIRWMIRRDLPEVLEIDRDGFDRPWTEGEFLEVLRESNCIGMVAEDGDRIAGYLIYRTGKRWIWVERLAVRPDMRRKNVGAAMVRKLMGKLGPHRPELRIDVPEGNLAAQVWLRALGVPAIGLDHDEGVYWFRLRIPARSTV